MTLDPAPEEGSIRVSASRSAMRSKLQSAEDHHQPDPQPDGDERKHRADDRADSNDPTAQLVERAQGGLAVHLRDEHPLSQMSFRVFALHVGAETGEAGD